jgi:hypothetical protein
VGFTPPKYPEMPADHVYRDTFFKEKNNEFVKLVPKNYTISHKSVTNELLMCHCEEAKPTWQSRSVISD